MIDGFVCMCVKRRWDTSNCKLIENVTWWLDRVSITKKGFWDTKRRWIVFFCILSQRCTRNWVLLYTYIRTCRPSWQGFCYGLPISLIKSSIKRADVKMSFGDKTKAKIVVPWKKGKNSETKAIMVQWRRKNLRSTFFYSSYIAMGGHH